MEVAVDVEDDVFFADLSKQISLLIMDDEEQDSVAHCPSVSLQAFSQAISPAIQTSSILYEQTCRRESKGTGVFIPRLSHTRRKNRQGRHNINNSSNQRKFHETPRGLQQVPCKIKPSLDSSFNHRR